MADTTQTPSLKAQKAQTAAAAAATLAAKEAGEAADAAQNIADRMGPHTPPAPPRAPFTERVKDTARKVAGAWKPIFKTVVTASIAVILIRQPKNALISAMDIAKPAIKGIGAHFSENDPDPNSDIKGIRDGLRESANVWLREADVLIRDSGFAHWVDSRADHILGRKDENSRVFKEETKDKNREYPENRRYGEHETLKKGWTLASIPLAIALTGPALKLFGISDEKSK